MSGTDNAGAIPFFDGTGWETVQPNEAFGTKSVGLRMCDGVLRFGPCTKMVGNNFYMED
jgi:hypothetical protein